MADGSGSAVLVDAVVVGAVPDPNHPDELCGDIDTFDRTFTPGWGPADPGPGTWADTYSFATGHSTVSSDVNPSRGGRMTLDITDSAGFNHQEQVDEELPLPAAAGPLEIYSWQFRADLLPVGTPGLGLHMPALSYWLDASIQWRLDQFDGTSFGLHTGAEISIGGQTLFSLPAFDPSAWYNVIYKVDRAHNAAGTKVWKDGDAEPAYVDYSGFIFSIAALGVTFHWADLNGVYQNDATQLNVDTRHFAWHCEDFVPGGGGGGEGDPYGPIGTGFGR